MSVTKVITKAVAEAIGSVHACGVPEQIKGMACGAAAQAVQEAAEEAISHALEVIESKLVEEGYELVEGLVEGILHTVFHGEEEEQEGAILDRLSEVEAAPSADVLPEATTTEESEAT